MAKIQIHTSLTNIGEQHWQTSCAGEDPFLSYTYLSALEQNQCLGKQNGWIPQHLTINDANGIQAAMPVYLKSHSHGEFVFDWAWARAALSAGIEYYPKLVTAIPYTPVTGPRYGNHEATLTRELLQGVRHLANETGASSWHLLFPDADTCQQLLSSSEDMQLLERHNCHFAWFNRDYKSFDDFLQRFSSRKRKNLNRERRKLDQQKVTVERVNGANISPQLLQEFYQFYQSTYHRRGQTPYLNFGFFQQLLAQMAERLLLVTAQQHEKLVGAALFIRSEDTLYGRWWGGLPSVDCLHFEVCYYQGIEYAIEQGLAKFDPGIQGEHKLLRGFEPELTRSLHWIKEPALSHAVDRWLQDERLHIQQYQEQARAHLPFKDG
ncbi:MAG: GNAT family N-acetyltransferase [Motiliproteus sp.]